MISAFDLDKTLLKVNSSYAFSKYLFRKGIFSKKERVYCLLATLRYSLGFNNLVQLHLQVFDALFRGRFSESFREHVPSFLDEFFFDIQNTKVLNCLLKAKSEGQLIVLLSSSPSFLVGPIAERFEISHWSSTVYEIDQNGQFNKITQLMTGVEKALYLRQLVDSLNLSLKTVTAYSDSADDIPFLSISGNPIGVDPDSKLKKICKAKNWTIL